MTRRIARALAGPALIVASVLAVLHFYAFSNVVSRQNPDLLALWLPTHCFLGTSLAAGHIPAWNPHVMAGAPFAADPQSGWMYAPAMLLYTALSCGTALRWFIVLQPLLAGLGVYAFCRSEGLSRPAATVGGLALSLSVAGSQVVVSLPFSATLAWTALLLAAASRLLRSRGWAARAGWLALTALAWGQLAAAHLSTGLVLGTAALGAYVVAKTVADVRSGARTGRDTAAVVAALLVSFPLVNAAVLLPRIAYLPRTSLALGYDRLEQLSRALSHGLAPVTPLPGRGLEATTPLRYTLSPGLYLGATVLALTFAGWRGRHRALAVGFGAFGALCYVLSLTAVAGWLTPHIRHWPLVDFYLIEPARLEFGLVLSLAILAAIGLDGWLAARSWRERLGLVAPAVVVWGALPLLFRADLGDLRLFAVAAAVAAIALPVVARRPSLAFVVPLAVAGELVAAGVAGHASSGGPAPEEVALGRLEPRYAIERPDVHLDAYLRPGPIVRTLRRRDSARYVSIDPREWDPRGLHVHQAPRSWPLLAMQQSMLFGLEEAQGYNATQSLRYWEYLRAADPRRIKYNAAFLRHPDQGALNVLGVGWIVSPTDRPPEVASARPVTTEGRFTLFRIPAPPRVEAFPVWSRVAGASSALRAVTRAERNFLPSQEAVVEGPGPTPARMRHRAVEPYPVDARTSSAQDLALRTDAPRRTLVVIRTSFDPNWHATIDGRPADLRHADDVLQGVVVPRGRHTVRLRYDDPTIGYGMVASAASLVLLLVPAGVAAVARRRRRRGGVKESPSDADGGADAGPHEAP